MAKTSPAKPFHIAWDPDAVARVREKVRAYVPPPAPKDAGWRYGCDPAFLEKLRRHWVEGFDVNAAQAELNRYPQVIARVGGLDLHAVHVVGEAQGTRPLLLTHGWPGSVYEFWRVIEPLAFPSSHGGRPEDAFDLVIPSLPGFGFSGRLEAPLSSREVAGLFDQLMRKAFGYRSYLAQGGDWGAGVSSWLALDQRKSVRAIHLNYLQVSPSRPPKSQAEKAWKAAFDAKEAELGAYAHLQMTRPQSLAYAMQDNPVAQAAWLVERFHDWADLRERSFEEVFSLDQLLTDVMIYVMNDAFATASWLYAGTRDAGGRQLPKGKRVRVPTAFSAYPDPRTVNPPRSWVERGYNLTRWTDQPRGGHFAAMEAPDLFVADLREWAREL